MTFEIISGPTWGRRDWSGTPYSVSLSERRYFVVHYDGGHPIERTGFAIPRTIDNTHHNNGWSGIGYNFVVSQAGEIFEGRGWNFVGAHCPGRNRDGIGVQVAVGGNQKQTDIAEAAVLWLYEQARAKTGRVLTKGRHGDWYPTECCGPQLTPWTKSGMPTPTNVEAPPTTPELLPSQLVTASGYTFATFFPVWATLAKGQVFWAENIALQYRLNRYARNTAFQHQLTLDGDFGTMTDAAVRAYQYWQLGREQVDGVVGPITARKLGLTT